jgi:ATP-dependent helicase/nuclease subunit B
MRVTEFRDYLACPYRYYLRHRLGLVCRSDAAAELDEAAFGSLAHLVLCRFGRDPISGSTDAEKIRAWLSDALDRAAAEAYGKGPLPAVWVQIEQLRVRLAALARWQADWTRKGWRIEHVEASPEEKGSGLFCRNGPEGASHKRVLTPFPPEAAALVVDGEPMSLRGRIDRIDVHGSGKRVLFDYKTSDTARGPDRTHRRDGRWVDLQLPLYRRLAAGLGIGGELALGYVVLPKDAARTGHLLAEWTEAELAEAEAAAADVIRKVRAEKFWPPASPPPAGFEPLAAICHDDQLVAVLAAEEGGDL